MKTDKIILFFSSVFGLGYVKYAPGTFGSFAGILLWAFFVPQNYAAQLFFVAVMFAFSVIFAHLAEEIYGNKDDQRIVIDEVAGVWVSVAFLPKTIFFLVAGFLLFRLFDIKKPFFIKKLQAVRGGLGVTIDDIAAGVAVNLILQIVRLAIK